MEKDSRLSMPGSLPDDVQVKKAVKAFLRQESDAFAELMGVIPGMDERMKTPPDMYGCERLFLMYFINDDMEDDFPLIAKDFLAHEFAKIGEYDDTDFVNVDTGDKWPGRLFNDFVLNLMMNAADGGSEYARALFLYLYRTYYKKEYKTLKKFSYLSKEDVLTLAGPEEEMASMMGTVARILTIARFSGIEIGRDCDLLYGSFNRLADFQDEDFEEERKIDESHGKRFREAKEYIEANFDKDKLYKLDAKMSRFVGNVFKHLGYSEDIAESCDDNYHGIVMHLASTLALLKKSYSSKEFTIEEITVYGAVYHIASALTCNLDWMADELRTVTYGMDGTDFYDHFGTKFNPEEINIGNKEEKPRTIIDKTKPKTSAEGVDTAALLKELDTLRSKVRKIESDNNSLRSELNEKKSEAESVSELSEKLENATRELAALRSYVYNLTEEEKEAASESLDEMKAFLSKKNIIIIGGHTNWVSKIKAVFPDWVYVNPDASGSTDASIVANADKVYFFTDIISHSKYYRYMNVVREKKADFGYIHGVNIEKNIRDIYKDIKE